MGNKIIACILALALTAALPLWALAAENGETETAATEETEDGSTEPETEPAAAPTAEPTPEPTAAPTTPPAGPSEPSAPEEKEPPASLRIDTEHRYPGMASAYEDGYVPSMDGSSLCLVLPLLPEGQLRGDEIKVSLDLGGSAASPFRIASYEKVFRLETHTPENGGGPVTLFLVRFDIPLSPARQDGVYPVTVTASGYDTAGNPVSRAYTIYVTITDGKTEEPAPPPVELPPVETPPVETATAEPVVYIGKTVLEPGTPLAGEAFTLTVTLRNSLTTKSVKNMLVTVDTGSLQLSLLEDTNVFPVEKIAPGGEETLTLRVKADASLPAGKYPLNFRFQYDSGKTLNLSSSGSTLVEVRQSAKMELVMPRFPEQVTAGETIPLSLQVMNMGRDPMFNVRCVVSGFGLAPSNTGYIGKMEAGTSASTKIDLYIVALNASAGNESGQPYGGTAGTVTLVFEDESGSEYQQETTFSTTVNRPVMEVPKVDGSEEKQEEAAGKWRLSVIVLGGVALVAGIGLFLRQRKKKRGGAYL